MLLVVYLNAALFVLVLFTWMFMLFVALLLFVVCLLLKCWLL